MLLVNFIITNRSRIKIILPLKTSSLVFFGKGKNIIRLSTIIKYEHDHNVFLLVLIFFCYIYVFYKLIVNMIIKTLILIENYEKTR